jgi:hypothetical protein
MAIVLLKQRDLFTKRWRNLEALDDSELTIQIALVARLRREVRDGVLWYHVPNGEWRDKRSAAKLKAMGTRPGVADLEFHWRARGRQQTLFLELKSAKGRQSDSQIEFAERVRAIGYRYETASSSTEAIAILQRYGLLKVG